MAGEHDIEALIRTAMGSLREMMDVNTIVGETIQTAGGVSVVPVSKVCCGFVAGGGDCCGKQRSEQPFMGGSGAGLHVQPVGFLVLNGEQIHLIPVCDATPIDKMVDAIPILTDKVKELLGARQGDKPCC